MNIWVLPPIGMIEIKTPEPTGEVIRAMFCRWQIFIF